MDLIDIGIWIVFVLGIISVAAPLLLEVFNLVKDAKALIKTGIVLVGLLALFGISYALSDNAVLPGWAVSGVDESGSKLIGAGLIMMYVFLLVSIVGMILSEISKLFK